MKPTEEMINRFLGWKLPEDFHPDAGIAFDPVFNKGTPQEMRHEPSGTNLFCSQQATEMLEYVLATTPDTAQLLAALKQAREALSDMAEWDENGRMCEEYGCAAPNRAKEALSAIDAVMKHEEG